MPQMVAPAAGAWDGKRIKFNMIPESTTADLVKVSVLSRGGLVGWTIVLPGNVRDAAIPEGQPNSDPKAVALSQDCRSALIAARPDYLSLIDIP